MSDDTKTAYEKPNSYMYVRSMKSYEDMASFMDDYCNIGMKDYDNGFEVGKLLQSHHRTIQGSIIRFCLGVIVGLSLVDLKYTDARNEQPIRMGKQITEMLENGNLNMGYMI